MDSDRSVVTNFYDGKSILVTGATGFMGKVLLEKLLRDCPGLDTIYVLMREKRGLSPKVRLQKLLNYWPFTFHEATRAQIHKIRAIDGDVTVPDLGLDKLTRQELIDKVSIVFHVAASIRFDTTLGQSFAHNVFGTENVLQLCEQMRHLVSMVHVSTAFVNYHHDCMKEELPKIKSDHRKAIELVRDLVTEGADGGPREAELKAKLMPDWTNTYVYSKAVAEHLVTDYQCKFPIAIVRPTIVVTAFRDPVPGWIDTVQGPSGLALAISVGLLQDVDLNYSMKPVVVPVDHAVNAMICSAWWVATDQGSKSLKIINAAQCIPYEELPTVGELAQKGYKDGHALPPIHMFRTPMKPRKSGRPSRLRMWYVEVVQHLLVAYILDALIWLAGRKPILVRSVHRIRDGIKLMRPFMCRDWKVETNNLKRMAANLNQHDLNRFDFKPTGVKDVDQYLIDSMYGVRRYLLKDPDSTIPAAKLKLNFLYAIHYLWNIFIVYLLVKGIQVALSYFDIDPLTFVW